MRLSISKFRTMILSAMLFFGMAADQNLNNIRMQRGIPTVDNKTLYMILGFIIPIVLVCLVQNEINKLAPAAA